MFKMGNTHYVKHPTYYKRMKTGNMVLNGNVTTSDTYGYLFGDTTSYADIGLDKNWFNQTGDFTLEFRMQINVNTKSQECCLFSMGNATADNAIHLTSGTNGFAKLYIHGTGGTLRTGATTYSFTNYTNGMHNFAVTFSNSGDVKMYINGSLCPMSCTGTAIASLNRQSVNQNIYLGRYSNSETKPLLGGITQFHYSPVERSAKNIKIRANNKLYPIDEYSVLDWNYRTGTKLKYKGKSSKPKYVGD